MNSFVYRVTAQDGRWFVVHGGQRYGPMTTRTDAIRLAGLVAGSARQREIEVGAVELAPSSCATARRRGES